MAPISWRAAVITLVLVCASLARPSGAPQGATGATTSAPQARASGLVLGQVIDAQTNKPVPGATVTLTTAGARLAAIPGVSPAPPQVLTDRDGYFVLRDLPAGTYAFGASAPGYLYGGFGRRHPSGKTQPFVLAEGERTGDVVVRLWREAVVGGRVTDEAGTPMAGLNVVICRRVVRNGRTELQQVNYFARTDDRGVYSAALLPPGDYVVAVPAGMSVARLEQLTLDAPAAATLRASGATSFPAGGAARAGARVGDFVLLPGGPNTLVNRLPVAALPGGRLAAYVTTFHPASASLDEAGAIRLDAGEERTDVDVQLRPVPTAPVRGTLMMPDGPAVNLAVHLLPAFAVHTPMERTFEAAVAMTDRAGAFEFPAVPAGAYVLQAWHMPVRYVSLLDALPSEPSHWVEQPITVDAAPVTVTLALGRGAALSGRIVLEGSRTPPPARQFQPVLGAWFQPPWSLAFSSGPIAETRVTPEWEFMREGVPPGTYVPNLASTFRPPAGWYFKSATMDGRDLLRSPLVLNGRDVAGIVMTFTDRPTTLSGLAMDSTGRPDPDAAVFVFPTDHHAWSQNGLHAALAHAAATTQTGTYAFDHVPPGDYLVAAGDVDLLDDWLQASVVQSLAAQATAVTLTNGTATRLDVRRR